MAKFMPAREEAKPVRIIHDLDIIDSEKVGVKFNGKTYSIEDLKVGQGMKISLAYSKLIELEMKVSQGEQVEDVALAKAYYDLLSIVIPDITPSEILEMGQNRINMILNLISRKITADPTLAEEIQKKKLQDQQNQKKSIFTSFRKLLSYVTSTSGLTTKS